MDFGPKVDIIDETSMKNSAGCQNRHWHKEEDYLPLYSMNYEVRHNPEASRFEIALGDKIAHADYHLSGIIMTIFHVYTPPEYRGKGIAAKVTKFALDYARENNLKVIPQCPYAHSYIAEHKEYQSLLAE